MQVRAAADERAAALDAIVQKREEREQLVAGAAASPEVGVKGSPAAAEVLSALNRAKDANPPAAAAELHAQQWAISSSPPQSPTLNTWLP